MSNVIGYEDEGEVYCADCLTDDSAVDVVYFKDDDVDGLECSECGTRLADRQ